MRHVPRWRPTAKVQRNLLRRELAHHEASGATGAEAVANQPAIDENIGHTVPPGVHQIDHRIAAELAQVQASAEAAVSRGLALVAKFGTEIERLSSRLDGSGIGVDPGGLTTLAVLGHWVALVVITMGAGALDGIVFQTFGLPPFETLTIAMVAAGAQVTAAYQAGGTLKDLASGRASGAIPVAKLCAELGTALALTVAVALFRARSASDTLGTLGGNSSGGVLTLALIAIGLGIEFAALGVGYRFASADARERIVYLRLRRQVGRTTKQLRRTIQQLRGQLEISNSLMLHVASQGRAALSSYYDRALQLVGAEAGAHLAAQHEAFAGAIDQRETAWGGRVEVLKGNIDLNELRYERHTKPTLSPSHA